MFTKSRERLNPNYEERSTALQTLKNAGIGVKRGVNLQSGSKAPISHDLCPLGNTNGNYGIYAGDRLLILDIDDYKGDLPGEVRSFLDKHPTLTDATPHGGTHLFYTVPKDAPEQIEEVAGKKNPKIGECLEVKSHNQYVVGPGSQLDGCTKEWCGECRNPSGGHYTTTEARPIAELPFERFLEIVKEFTEEPPETQNAAVPAGDHTFDGEVEEWIDTARDNDEYLDELMEWAGSTNTTPTDFDLRYQDRSQNEVALAQKLMWRFGSFDECEQIVRRLISRLHPPKWEQSGQSYRDSVIRAAEAYTIDLGEFYQPKNGGERSVMQCHADAILLEVAFIAEGTFTTKDISEWQTVEYDQTLRVLNDLKSAGYLSKTFINRNEHWKKVAKIPTNGSEYEMILNQYKSLSEVNRQRHEYQLQQ